MIKAFDLKRFDLQNEEKIVLLPSEIEDIKNTAFQNGEKEGFENGKKEGFSLGEKSEMEKNNKINLEIIEKLTSKISEDFTKIKNENNKFYQDLGNEFFGLLKTISDKYFDKIAKIDFVDDICTKISDLLENGKIQNNIQIEVSNDLEKAISEFVEEKYKNESLSITVKGNSDFSRYDLKIYNENGFFQRSLEKIKSEFENMFINNEMEVQQ